MELLERDAEQAALAAALARARGGEGAVVLVEGPAGIGKSSLLAAARRLAERDGTALAAASGATLERGFSFGIALQLLGPVLAAEPPASRAALLSGAARWAAPLLDPGHGETDGELFGLVHGLFWVTAGLADRGPLLLTVDDAQWSDDESLQFLHYLAQRIEGLPVTLALAVRTGEPDAGALAALRAHPAAEVLAPAPLSPAAGAALVRASLPGADDALCDACERAAAGNPFYLRELIEAVSADGLPASAERLPAPVRASRSILARLERMPAACGRLAVAVAVCGDGASLAHAAALVGLEPTEARTAADALTGADLLRAEEPLGFVHPLVREVVYADVPPAERAGLHRENARRLAVAGAVPEQVAAQLLEGAIGSDRWARDALREAAARARARGAPPAAARYLRRALEEGATGEERGELLALTGLAEADAGESLGTERFAEAVALIETPRLRALRLFELSMALSHGGRYPHAADAADRGRRELGDRDRELAAKLDALYDMSAVYVDLTDAEATARRIHASIAAPGLEAEPTGRAVLGNASIGLAFAGVSAEMIQALAERALHRGAPVDDPFDMVAFNLAAFGILLAGDIAAAERASSAAVDAARRRGSMLELAAALHVRSMARFHAGQVAEAAADAESAVEAGRWGWGATLPMAHAQLVFALLERGDVDGAEAALELPGREQRWMVNVSYGLYLIARAAVWSARSRPAEALDQLRLAGQLAEAVNARSSAIAPWRPAAVALLLAAGDRDEAARLAAEDEERARAFGAPGPIGAALRARGLAAGGERGIELLRDSERVLGGSAARLEHARTLVELGAALRRANRRREAREPLRRGLDMARRGGAVVLAERAHLELRAAGARPRRLVLTGVESLTPSERRVAELAARGLTNREIAQRLYLTAKTVEVHLGHVYRKLGIGSRKELARALEPQA